jgi:hypothetical protein
MTDLVESLILDLVEWVEFKERTYKEALDSWHTSCPRLPVWEDALERGLLERVVRNGRSLLRATTAGLALLREKRPRVYAKLVDHFDDGGAA